MKSASLVDSFLLLAGATVLCAAATPPPAAPNPAPPLRTISVALDGTGDFKNVQEAVNAAPDNAATPTLIHIKTGTYAGQVEIPRTKTHLTFQGDDAANTILSWDHNVYDPPPPGATQFDPGFHVAAADVRATGITFRNTSGDHGQALAVRVDADRVAFTKCRFLGWQDTLMVNNGRQYFGECYIEGRVDFIYGSGTAVFDRCEIHSKNGGYITAANTPAEKPFGLVFLDCRLTGDNVPWQPSSTNPATTLRASRPDARAFLGRPWRPDACVTFIRCWMGDHIRPEGWNNWGKASNEQTARYSEYQSSGPGGSPEKRVSWAKQLTAEQAGHYTIGNILAGADLWDPRN
jgi:pectinesterase